MLSTAAAIIAFAGAARRVARPGGSMSKSIAEYLIRVLRLLIRESAHLDDDAMRDGCQVQQKKKKKIFGRGK